MLNRLAACSLFSKTKLVLRWIGTARAPVAGSGAAPACSARVSKPGSEYPDMRALFRVVFAADCGPRDGLRPGPGRLQAAGAVAGYSAAAAALRRPAVGVLP